MPVLLDRKSLLPAWLATLVACWGGEGVLAENTELNVIVSDVLIETVEYTIHCIGTIDVPLDEFWLDGELEVTGDRAVPSVSAETWEGLLRLPPGRCSIQLRARDGDGEVRCAGEETFTVDSEEEATEVNIVLPCENGQIRVPDFTPYLNLCPELLVLSCDELDPATADTSCKVRFRDQDATCNQSCDPQSCTATPEGLSCTRGPDPGVSTTIACTNALPDCTGDGTPDSSCTFDSGMSVKVPVSLDEPCMTPADCGAVGAACVAGLCDFSAAAPRFDAGFVVACLPPEDGDFLPGTPATCYAVVSDGDVDCDKTQVVDLDCPGFSP